MRHLSRPTLSCSLLPAAWLVAPSSAEGCSVGLLAEPAQENDALCAACALRPGSSSAPRPRSSCPARPRRAPSSSTQAQMAGRSMRCLDRRRLLARHGCQATPRAPHRRHLVRLSGRQMLLRPPRSRLPCNSPQARVLIAAVSYLGALRLLLIFSVMCVNYQLIVTHRLMLTALRPCCISSAKDCSKKALLWLLASDSTDCTKIGAQHL